MSSSQSITRLARIAVLVAIGDYVTKAVAAAWLASSHAPPESLVGFALIHNDQGAFGLSAGAYTWQINLALTLSAILLTVAVSRHLARLDPSAPDGLGLIVGGAIGNLVSLIASPFGVLDFIAVRSTADSALVLNVADIAAYVGLAMLVRTGVVILRAMRHAPVAPAFATLSAFNGSVDEVEVPRIVFVEPKTPRRREEGPRRDEDGRPTAPGRKRKGNRPIPPQRDPAPPAGSEISRASL